MGSGVLINIFPSLPPCPFFPLHAYSLNKYFLALVTLYSCQIQDGGIVGKCTLAPKIHLHCRLVVTT